MSNPIAHVTSDRSGTFSPYPTIFSADSSTTTVHHNVVVISTGYYFTVGELKTALPKSGARNDAQCKIEYMYEDWDTDADEDTMPEHTKLTIEWDS